MCVCVCVCEGASAHAIFMAWKDVRTIQHYFARVSIIHSAALFAVQRDFLWVPIQRRAEIRDLFRFFLSFLFFFSFLYFLYFNDAA